MCVCALFIRPSVWKPKLCKLFPPLCFPLFHRHSQSMNPILLLLSLSLHSRPPSLSHPLPFSYLLSTPCWFVLHSNFPRLESDRGEADKTWAWKKKEKVGDDGGMLMEGAVERAGKASRYQGVTLRREIWILLRCFLSLSPTIFPPVFPTLLFSSQVWGKCAQGAQTRYLFDLRNQDARKQKSKCDSTLTGWDINASCLW